MPKISRYVFPPRLVPKPKNFNIRSCEPIPKKGYTSYLKFAFNNPGSSRTSLGCLGTTDICRTCVFDKVSALHCTCHSFRCADYFHIKFDINDGLILLYLRVYTHTLNSEWWQAQGIKEGRPWKKKNIWGASSIILWSYLPRFVGSSLCLFLGLAAHYSQGLISLSKGALTGGNKVSLLAHVRSKPPKAVIVLSRLTSQIRR